jgi:hypothetical protein
VSELQLTYWDYVKEAFSRKVTLPLLGKMPINHMALGVIAVLGIANPGFWFLGAAAEVLFVALLSSNARFQKLVQGERLLAAQEAWEEKIRRAVERLSPDSHERYQRLLSRYRTTLGVSETLESETVGGLRDMKARNLNQLLAIFLRLLTSREVIAENLRNLDRVSLEREIARLEERLAAVDPEGDVALTRSLQGTVEIQRKRLENLARAEASLQVIDAELLRIEQQAELIREESAVSGKPELLSLRLDTVSSVMSDTTRWMDEHADLLGELGEGEEVDLVELPRLPETEG